MLNLETLCEIQYDKYTIVSICKSRIRGEVIYLRIISDHFENKNSPIYVHPVPGESFILNWKEYEYFYHATFIDQDPKLKSFCDSIWKNRTMM